MVWIIVIGIVWINKFFFMVWFIIIFMGVVCVDLIDNFVIVVNCFCFVAGFCEEDVAG